MEKGYIYKPNDDGSRGYPLLEKSTFGDKYPYYVYQNEEHVVYVVDSKFSLINAYDERDIHEDIHLNNEEKSKVQEEVKQFIKPLIDEQPVPIFVSLQWLYDYLNHDRFN